MIKYKYRFKTEEEFIQEYGNYWREVNGILFINNMNFLLGTDIDKDTLRWVLVNDRLDLRDVTKRLFGIQGRYAIAAYMIKEITLGINYNEKKILVYE